jgi:hypothetical protein
MYSQLHNNCINPILPKIPFSGVRNTLKVLEGRKKMILHPRFLGQLGRQFVYDIQLKKHFGRSPSFSKNEFCKKKTDDSVRGCPKRPTTRIESLKILGLKR